MVPADDSVAVYFAVIPTKIGRIPIKVTAQSTSAADAVERQLLVEVSRLTSLIREMRRNSSFSRKEENSNIRETFLFALIILVMQDVLYVLKFPIMFPIANQLQENLLLVVPPDSVDGSSKAAVTIIGTGEILRAPLSLNPVWLGDLMGPTLNNLERMVRLPTGCGEQNAASFAPNIYVREYLVAIRKLSNELEHKTDKYMMTGTPKTIS